LSKFHHQCPGIHITYIGDQDLEAVQIVVYYLISLVVGSSFQSIDCVERGKREVYCDKQVGKVMTVLNCVLKGSWGEGGSGGIRKKLKSEYAAYLESKYRRNDGSLI